MAGIRQTTIRNQLLLALSSDDFGQLAEHLEPCEFHSRFMLTKSGEPPNHAYFLDSGIGSIIAKSPEGQQAEAGLFGREGWCPTTLSLGGDTSPYDTFIQVPGDGHRIRCDILVDLMSESKAVRALLLKFAQTLATQTSFTALSNAVHQIDERLARWLLMCHDRIDSDEIALTHDFLSIMLAVRRPSVTTSLHVLEGNRFIKSERGVITIRDRAGLEAFAADAYGPPEAEYERIIGPLRRQ